MQPLRELKYLEAKSRIRTMAEQFPPGSSIPPERELAAACDVSRTTVRKALAELEAEGRLVRRQGSGTYVAEPKLAWPLTASGITEQASDEHTGIHTTVLSTQHHPATDELADRLGLRTGRQVLAVESLRSVNGAPLAIERAYLAARRYPGLADAVVRTGSVPEALREGYGVSVAHAVSTIETAPAGPQDAALLRTDAGAPLLLMTRHSHTAQSEPVEWAMTWCRGDRASFVARLN